MRNSRLELQRTIPQGSLAILGSATHHAVLLLGQLTASRPKSGGERTSEAACSQQGYEGYEQTAAS